MELTNLANGCAGYGDQLAAKICRDAINEIERLREFAARIHEVCEMHITGRESHDTTKTTTHDQTKQQGDTAAELWS
jgi:hypothetical protein